LYAVTVPFTGGNTRFANAAAIYEALPERIRTRLDGLEAENAYEYSATTQMVGEGEEVASQVHPMVIRHPVTGVPSLFVSPLMTRRVVGVSEEESQQLLGELRLVLERDEFVYEHHWQVGDLVLWDNRCVLHARTDFDPAEARILRRVSLAGQGAPQAYALSAR
ncbi:MAG: TauD/TfdA family dioxygenase, partial [Acidimicrobiales bacterium]|nr:TauD/TfdA family dioxygenase [Acidimicrobiales bacterium]